MLTVMLLLGACQSPVRDRTHRDDRVSSGATSTVTAASFAAAVREADRIEVSRRGADSASLLTARGSDVATRFIDTVRIDESAGDFRCACDGDHLVEFFSGDHLLATITVHHNHSIRWLDGPWASDAALILKPDVGYTNWFFRNGGNFQHSSDPGLIARTLEHNRTAELAFPSHFPEVARSLFMEGQGITIQSNRPRRVASPLREMMPDGVQLAAASFRALGSLATRWQEDDRKTGMVQTALASIDPTDLAAALRLCADDDQALCGAARFYFKMSMDRTLGAAFNGEWLPRLADAILRKGDLRDQPLMLVYLAESTDPAAHRFLRELATGQRTYPWLLACEGRGDVPQEPSLPAAAALMLALHGEQQAGGWIAGAPDKVFGLDAAAAEIARSLQDPSVPLKPAHFKFRSHTLGFAAGQALARQPAEAISVPVFVAGLGHQDHWVVREVGLRGQALGVQRHRESPEDALHAGPVDQYLAHEDPAEAIRQCTEHLTSAQGATRGALLLIRAVARENTDDAAGALADYGEALQVAPHLGGTIHQKLAWLQWGAGTPDESAIHAEQALRQQPEADMFVLRGLAKFAREEFDPGSDLDFLAALSLQPNHGYAGIFQHLTAHLGGRPEQSRLSGRPRYAVPPPRTLTVNFGTLSAGLSSGEIAPWPAAIIAYFDGGMDEDGLLERARLGTMHDAITQTCEAHFYIAQMARMFGDTNREREYLSRSIVVQLPQVAEYRLARIRLEKIR